ncbi:MAG TPA: DNRLRE domain-containing protein [Byssovorax sp.]
MRLSLLELVLALAATACGASPSAAACGPTSACAQGSTCVVGLCRSSEPAPASRPEATRMVLEPIDAAVISSRGGDGARPEAFALGRAGAGTVELLMRFAPAWADDADVAFAFVVLAPVDGAPPPASPVRVSTARVLEAWSSDSVTWGRQPRLGPLDAAELARPASRASARLDVTRAVRAWSRLPRDEHGLAVVADGSDAFGAVYAFGFGAAPGPRLEVYLRSDAASARDHDGSAAAGRDHGPP